MVVVAVVGVANVANLEQGLWWEKRLRLNMLISVLINRWRVVESGSGDGARLPPPPPPS